MANQNKKFLDINGVSHLKLIYDNKLSNKVNKELKTGSNDEYKVLSDNNLTDELVTKIQNAGVSDFTGSYNDLTSKPKINNVTLNGELSLNDLGIQPAAAGKGLSTNDYTTAEKTKLAGITEGAQPNAIGSISVNGAAQTIDNNKNVEITVPTNNNQLTNGAGYQTATDVETIVNTKVSSTYKAKGSVAFANLPALISANEGNVYNITDSFTTTSDFVEGTGKEYPAGTNIVIVNTTGNTYKYDILAGFVDLSAYAQTSDFAAITNAEIDALFE